MDPYEGGAPTSNNSHRPRALTSKLSFSFLQQKVTASDSSSNLVTNPTTAVTLANANQADIAFPNEADDTSLLHPSYLNRYSLASGTSPYLSAVGSSDEEFEGENIENSELTSLFQNLMAKDSRRGDENGISTPSMHNVFTDDEVPLDESFLMKRVALEKLDNLDTFKGKLKHFFILSTAGKPIYSMNGSDGLIMGYMGLITTIVSTFHESLKSEFHHISQDKFRLVVMDRNPLLLVAATNVSSELVPCSGDNSETSIIEEQLRTIYNYILAVLSKPVICKNFDRRMNYDLRNILSHQDFNMLDSLCMKLTYGFTLSTTGEYEMDNSFYIGAMLNNAITCAKIRKSTRAKLDAILISCKRLKAKQHSSNGSLIILDKLLGSDKERFIASDLLFGFLTIEEKVLSYLRPKAHHLGNEDIRTLLSTVSSSLQVPEHDDAPELWIPLCMPNFNDSGFLYLFVKQLFLPTLASPIIIILLSGNKSSFYDMKEVANYITYRIKRSSAFCRKLSDELVHMSTSTPVLRELGISIIRHFIYKRKSYNQFYMDNLQFDGNMSHVLRALSHVNHLYSNLARSKTSIAIEGILSAKKLTYTRWQLEGGWLTGFLLQDEKSEFYCICGGSGQAQMIIEESLRIIRWCERYNKRLFVGDGVTF